MTCMGRDDICTASPISAAIPDAQLPASAGPAGPSFTRSKLLLRGAKAGAALLVGGAALGAQAANAGAEPLPDGDLAYARLLVGVELLSIDFYARALDAK